jgi:biotin carboxylase
LTYKDAQRRRLAEAAVDEVRCATFADEATRAAAVAHVGFPAVLKPVQGNGSTHVVPVTDANELRAALAAAERAIALPEQIADHSTFTAGTTWQLEEMFQGVMHPGADWLGNYLSVESVALAPGVYWHFAITDRLPEVWPLRETGLLMPTQLPAAAQAEVQELVARTLAALGVAHGVTHTEVKLTPRGPRVIEVNGRLGGFVADLLGQISRFDPTELAVRAAMGPVARGPDPVTDGFALALLVQPPAWATRIDRLVSPAELCAIPGVWRVDQRLSAGDVVDYRAGTVSRVQTVWLKAPTAALLHEVHQRVAAALEAGNVYRA